MQAVHPANSLKEPEKARKEADALAGSMYDKYAPFLFSIISTIIPDCKKAEETLIQVFLYLNKHPSPYTSTQQPSSVSLMNIARNMAVDNLCRMQHDYPCDKNFTTLSLAEKTVFALYYFRSFPISRIAEVLHLPAGKVEKLLQAAEAKAQQ